MFTTGEAVISTDESASLSACIDLLGFGADSSVDMTASPVVNIASVLSVWIRCEVPSLVKVVYSLHLNLSVIPIRHVAT